MSKTRVVAVVWVCGLLAWACGTSVAFTPLNPPPHPVVAKSAQDVVVYMGKQPDRPFIEIGMIEAQQRAGGGGSEAVIQDARAEAALRGCDGLIILGSHDRTAVVGHTANGTGSVSTVTFVGYRASCIVFLAEGDQGTAPRAP